MDHSPAVQEHPKYRNVLLWNHYVMRDVLGHPAKNRAIEFPAQFGVRPVAGCQNGEVSSRSHGCPGHPGKRVP